MPKDVDKLTTGQIEKLFEELDKKPHRSCAQNFWSFFEALIEEGFTRRESLKLTEIYANYLYDLAMMGIDKDENPG